MSIRNMSLESIQNYLSSMKFGAELLRVSPEEIIALKKLDDSSEGINPEFFHDRLSFYKQYCPEGVKLLDNLMKSVRSATVRGVGYVTYNGPLSDVQLEYLRSKDFIAVLWKDGWRISCYRPYDYIYETFNLNLDNLSN